MNKKDDILSKKQVSVKKCIAVAIQILHCLALPIFFKLQIPSVADPRPLFLAN